MKVLKVYLFNCPTNCDTQIYCIKHDIGEDVSVLKEKIFVRYRFFFFQENKQNGLKDIFFGLGAQNCEIYRMIHKFTGSTWKMTEL